MPVLLKWILKWIVGMAVLLGLLAAGLWVAGQREHAGRHAGSVTIEAPAESIFPWLLETSLRRQWQQGLEQVTPLDDRGLTQGARFTENVVLDDRTLAVQTEIALLEAPRRLIVTTHAGGDFAFDYEVRWTLEERRDGTRLECIGDGVYHGALLRLIEPLITLAANGQLQSDLDRLRTLVEADGSAPDSSR